MLLGERENIHFLSHSLSQLSRMHVHGLQKFESTRSLCKGLAGELKERLVLKDSEIIQLRQHLENAHSNNIISNHTSASRAKSSTSVEVKEMQKNRL